MELVPLLFLMFAVVAVYAGLRVIMAKNPVHAVLYLVLAFFNVAGLWLMLQAEFLAIILIMVYVGAVMVLFLFVVMMLDIDIQRIRSGFWRHLPLGGFIGALMVFEMSVVLSGRYFGLLALPEPAMPARYSNTRELGRQLFTDYAFPVELASIILLVGIIAAVMLTLRHRSDKKRLDPAKQIAVKASERLRLVAMPSEKPAGQGSEEHA